ncbi:MAG TPA: hypothetical protein VFU43_08085 [Streptosporangiaceae bacterium]|nr:hypothetical protein [Streptosporangiaceae bacterium]
MGRNGDPQGDDYGLPHIDIVVPDDARELDRDVVAYRREQRQRRRRARWRRVFHPLTRYGVAAPIIAAAVLIAVISGTLLTVLGPHSAPRPASPPPAQRPSARPGQVGGPLPSGQVTIDGEPAALSDQRPAVIILVPPECRCDAIVTSIARQATARRIGVYLVAGPAPADRGLQPGPGNITATPRPPARLTPAARATADDGELRSLAKRNPGARVLADPEGALISAYRPEGLTAVLVHTDGVVGARLNDLRADQRFDSQLEPLQRPGQAALAPM